MLPSPFKSWQRVYSYDPTFDLTEGESMNVLGGEVALWSEQADSAVLDSKLWFVIDRRFTPST